MDEAPADPAVEAQVALVLGATRRANIYRTHRNLYMVLMTLAVMSVALMLNFYRTKPTFDPYGIDRRIIGSVFGALGVAQIVFLNLYRNLRLVRAALAASFSFTLFWGVSNTEQSFAGRASFQLPILYIALAALQLWLLVEPATNPVSRKANGK